MLGSLIFLRVSLDEWFYGLLGKTYNNIHLRKNINWKASVKSSWGLHSQCKDRWLSVDELSYGWTEIRHWAEKPSTSVSCLLFSAQPLNNYLFHRPPIDFYCKKKKSILKVEYLKKYKVYKYAKSWQMLNGIDWLGSSGINCTTLVGRRITEKGYQYRAFLCTIITVSLLNSESISVFLRMCVCLGLCMSGCVCVCVCECVCGFGFVGVCVFGFVGVWVCVCVSLDNYDMGEVCT